MQSIQYHQVDPYFFTILVSLHATEPFEQESVKSNRNFGGIGLGLAISKQIVMRHGGDIYINSSPGQGSLFTISLPVMKDAMAKITTRIATRKETNYICVTTQTDK